MRIVIDTNVIISTLITPKGKTAEILTRIFRDLTNEIYYSEEIVLEYAEVMSRKKFKIPLEMQSYFIKDFLEMGTLIQPVESVITFTDESDRKFYDLAQMVNGILITGNLKHYPDENFILSPNEFSERFLG